MSIYWLTEEGSSWDLIRLDLNMNMNQWYWHLPINPAIGMSSSASLGYMHSKTLSQTSCSPPPKKK